MVEGMKMKINSKDFRVRRGVARLDLPDFVPAKKVADPPEAKV
jgi:hypothetical protein